MTKAAATSRRRGPTRSESGPETMPTPKNRNVVTAKTAAVALRPAWNSSSIESKKAPKL